MPEDRLEQLLNEMRNENVPAEEVAAAKARVWQKIAPTAPNVCSEFRADLDSYATGRLEGSRRLLLEDHLSRCPACRRALAGNQDVPQPLPAPVVPRRILPVWTRWALAASLAAAALYVGRDRIDTVLAPSGPRATVVSVRGALYRLPEGILGAGAALREGEVVRTGMGARAMLRLRDGSSVEMNERTELSVRAAWSGQSIRLERGDVIVQAAKQRRGYLQVVTRDSVASVKGTIFAVSAGFAGSLVSVVQGSVQVQEPDGEHLLARGQQSASTRVLQGVPVRRSVAWSENAGKYNALLGELAQIETAIATTATAAPRTQPKLLPYLPAGAMFYLAVPNPGPIVQQATGLIEQRSQESSALREWWNSADRQGLKLLLDRVQALAPLIGDEIVLVVSRDAPRPAAGTPAVLAEVQPGRQANVQQALEQLLAGTRMVAHVSDKLLVASDSQAHLDWILGRLGQGATSPFAAEIASHYRNGVSLLLGYDAASMFPGIPNEGLAFLGVDKLKYVVFEQLAGDGSGQMQASLTFNGPRSGVASWLASPGVASSAEYVSTSAVGAVSICTRNPRQSFDEFVALVSRFNPRFQQELLNMEAKVGLRISDDVIAAFGTDFTLAIEKPTIPQPGWVAAVEVYQPASLDLAVRSFVEAVNREGDPSGQNPQLVVEQQQVDGRTWMVLRETKMNVSLYWTYDRGYVVLSQDRGLAAQAIATRAAGFPLVHSEQFRAQLPASSGLYQSGFVWLNTQGPLADLAAALGGDSVRTLLQSREPMLVVVSGDTERIRVASRTRLMSMLLTMMMAGGPHQTGRATNGPNIASH